MHPDNAAAIVVDDIVSEALFPEVCNHFLIVKPTVYTWRSL